MSTTDTNPAVELAERQHRSAIDAHAQARTAYQDIETRIAALADDAPADDVTALASELDTVGQTLEDTHAEVERTKANLETAERRAALPVEERRPATARGSLRSELVYRKDTHDQRDVLIDAYRAHLGDSEARERTTRNNREQEAIYRDKFGKQMRDVGTGAFAGLTIPQYLIDEFAPIARANGPLIAAMASVTKQLPATGMVIDISRITTGTAVAAQSSENAAVQETDADDTLLAVDIRQYAGQQDLSRQAVERSEGVVQAIFEDLTADWFTKVDSALINGAGTSGTVLGIRSTSGIVAVTYTDASPTVPELYPKVADAIQQIASGIYRPATTVLMHPRRWGWGTAALDSSNRPLFVPSANGPFNALAVGTAVEYGAVVGQLQGLPVITDANIPTNLGAGTNEDMIFVIRIPDHRLWLAGDGMPRRFTFEQANAPQSIRLAVWGEVAATFGKYPLASATIGGTGLVTPTF